MDGISSNLHQYISVTSLRDFRDLDFGDLDLIYQGHSLVSRISFEPVDGLFSNMHQYISETTLRADKILVTLNTL